MKRQLLQLTAFLCLMAGKQISCWALTVENKMTVPVMVHANFKWCNDDRFDLAPNTSKTIEAGLCTLRSITVTNKTNHQTTSYQTGQTPHNGILISTDNNGYPLISYK